ncbi:hypothetical protein IV203_010265 [Nitzschia inconspicua]|uniref:Uncharacterized protein n=1 Tax=Nitzschia inconspicua TaxID=303405 RepID=A0A9K3PKL7_9STRA|nr:hypothetical protein IV203_010265 [Nitzschia inconspicua]
MVRKLKSLATRRAGDDDDQMVHVDQPCPKKITGKMSSHNQSLRDEVQIKSHPPLFSMNSRGGNVTNTVKRKDASAPKQKSNVQSVHCDEQNAEETREVHAYEHRRGREKEPSRHESMIGLRQDMNEQNTVLTNGDETAGRQQENIREKVRHQFYRSSAFLSSHKTESSTMKYEDTSKHLAATLNTRPAPKRRVSKSLSPKKRSHLKQEPVPKRHASLSPRRRTRSSSQAPRRKSSYTEKAFVGSDGTKQSSSTTFSQRMLKTAVIESDFLRAVSRHEEYDSGSSDEALEFTKERYKRRKSQSTNRPDMSPVTRPKQQGEIASSPRKKPLSVKASPSEDAGSRRDNTNASSSEYESSTTGGSFTEAEKLRLKRQLKRRAVLKRKAAQTTQAKTYPMSFMDNVLASVASDFVTSLVGQLGLTQPFVFPTSPLAGESELNDEYNLLRWEDDVSSSRKSSKNDTIGASFAEIFRWDENVAKDDDSSKPNSSDDDSKDTRTLIESESMTVFANSRENAHGKSERGFNPKIENKSTSIMKTTDSSGPAIIDEKEISKVARRMVRLSDNSMTSEDGDTFEDLSSKSKETRSLKASDAVKTPLRVSATELAESTKVGEIQEVDDINLAVSSDSEEKMQQHDLKSCNSGDNDMNSLTYSLDDGNKPPRLPDPILSNDKKEEFSVSKLGTKFKEELPMRFHDPKHISETTPFKRDGANDLAAALSLSWSADDALLPSLGKDGSAMSRPKAETIACVAPSVNMEELKSKIKQYQERREGAPKSSKIAEDNQMCAAAISTTSMEEIASREPEFVPQEMAPRTRISSPELCQRADTLKFFRPSHLHDPEGAKMSQVVELETMSVPLVGHVSPGEKKTGSQQDLGPLPVDIDDMVSKIDRVVQRLLMTGKLPGAESSNVISDLEQQTLQNKTSELLRNLALLKRHRNSTTDEHTKEPSSMQSCTELVEAPFPSSLPPPKTAGSSLFNGERVIPINPPDLLRREPLSNLARIRARRDEAAMRIREKTMKLSGFENPSKHTGPIPITNSRTLDNCHQWKTVRSGCDISSNIATDLTLVNERFDWRKNHSSATKLLKSRGPPRPEAVSGFFAHLVKPTLQGPLVGANTQRSLNHSLSNNTNTVPMSTSDMDMEEWERMELEKLPLLLSKTKSEEQGEARFSKTNYDSRKSPLDAKNPSTMRQAKRQGESMIEEYDDTDEEDTDDTDSSGTLGSESDSERLERIASMIQELRLRRQQRH